MRKRVSRKGMLLLAVAVTAVLVSADLAAEDSSTDQKAVTEAGKAAKLIELKDVDQLRQAFNQDQGHPRLVLLLSPTCTVCVAGTRWVQKELLQAHPDADIAVYAVWFKVMRTDSREAWRDDLLPDSRVSRYWDDGQNVGIWYADNVTRKGQHSLEWDAWFLYGPDVTWGEEAPESVGWGRTIIDKAEDLEEKFLELTAQSELQAKHVLEIGNVVAKAINTLDFEAFMSTMSEDDQEVEEDWKAQTKSIQDLVGEIRDVTLDELALPDGAYLNFLGSKSTLGVYMDFDDQGKVATLQVTPGGFHKGGEGCAAPADGKDGSDGQE